MEKAGSRTGLVAVVVAAAAPGTAGRTAVAESTSAAVAKLNVTVLEPTALRGLCARETSLISTARRHVRPCQ